MRVWAILLAQTFHILSQCEVCIMPFSQFLKKADYLAFFISVVFFYIFYRIVFIKNGVSIFFILTIYSLLFLSICFKLEHIKYYFPKFSFFPVVTALSLWVLQVAFHPTPLANIASELTNTQILGMYNMNYLYGLPFVFLPCLLLISKYKVEHFFNMIVGFNLVYICFNCYLMFIKDYSRAHFFEHYNQIITYDFMMLGISSLVLLYSFYLHSILEKKYLAYCVLGSAVFAITLNLLHGTRGVWVIIPFLIIATAIFYRKSAKKFLIGFFMSIVLAAGFLSVNSDYIDQRLTAAYQDYTVIQDRSTQATSIGSRLIMWKTAVDHFESSPLVGVGIYQVAKHLCKMSQEGILAGSCLTHMHSIYFQELASRGIFGLAALLFSFLYPAFLFFKRWLVKPYSALRHLLTLSGIYTIGIVMLCGLTDFYFISNVSSTLYYLLVISLLTFIHREKPQVFE